MSVQLVSSTKVLYVISRAPYSNSSGQEGLDAVLIGASFDLDVSVLFIHDGVFQLKLGQDSSASELKQYTKTYNALDDFGIEKVYVHNLSIDARGLSDSQLMLTAIGLDNTGVQKLIAEQDRVFAF